MARLRTSGGRYRRTTLADFGHVACETCGRFLPLVAAVDEDGFADPIPRKASCRHCEQAGEGHRDAAD